MKRDVNDLEIRTGKGEEVVEGGLVWGRGRPGWT